MGVRLQLLGAGVTGMVGIFILATLGTGGGLSSTSAGLVLFYAMSFSSAINWLIRNQAELEMNMNSVERTTGMDVSVCERGNRASDAHRLHL